MNYFKMRRKDREMSEEFALELIDRLPFGVLSMLDGNGLPYGVPLSLIRKEKNCYFHSAQSGKKVEALKDGSDVCLSFVGNTQIPNLFSDSELAHFLKEEHKGQTLISKVFTTEFESAIAFGKIYRVTDEKESIDAMRLICEKYTPSKMHLFDLALRSGMKRTAIYRIETYKITAKRKKFDSQGEEMKWGRME